MKMLETVSRAMVRKVNSSLRWLPKNAGQQARTKHKEQIYRAKAARWEIASRSDRTNDAQTITTTLDVEGERDEAGGGRRNDRRHFGAVDWAVERVAFYGNAARGANEAFQFGARRELGSFGARVVIDLFFDDRSVEVVSAETESDLRDARREHDPVGLDVLEIVEQQARDRDVAEVEIAGRLREVRERRIVGMKRQRDKRDEPLGFVLYFTKLDEVIDAFFFGFHVAVKHCGV